MIPNPPCHRILSDFASSHLKSDRLEFLGIRKLLDSVSFGKDKLRQNRCPLVSINMILGDAEAVANLQI